MLMTHCHLRHLLVPVRRTRLLHQFFPTPVLVIRLQVALSPPFQEHLGPQLKFRKVDEGLDSSCKRLQCISETETTFHCSILYRYESIKYLFCTSYFFSKLEIFFEKKLKSYCF